MNDTYIIANSTDTGKVRSVNEDSMVTFDSPNGRVIAVCDGMGGQAAGDVASRLACDIITDILTNNTFATPAEAITRACMAANQGIMHRAAQNPDLSGMGATCVMVIIKDGLVYYGWVGDSRIYYINKGQITQLSRDQSYVQRLVDTGQITAAEAEHHPQKNEILNALGLATMTPPELSPTPLTPDPGSVILLCSDGLSGMVDNARIEQIVSAQGPTLQAKADQLVKAALDNGGLDNITVQLVQFGRAKAATASSGASATKSKASMGLWLMIAAVVLLAAAIVYFFVLNDNTPQQSSLEQTAPDTHQTIDNRSKEPEPERYTSPEHKPGTDRGTDRGTTRPEKPKTNNNNNTTTTVPKTKDKEEKEKKNNTTEPTTPDRNSTLQREQNNGGGDGQTKEDIQKKLKDK